MPSQYDALLEPPKRSEYDALLGPTSAPEPQPKSQASLSDAVNSALGGSQIAPESSVNGTGLRQTLQDALGSVMRFPAKALLGLEGMQHGRLHWPTDQEVETPLLSNESVQNFITKGLDDPLGALRPEDAITGVLRGIGDVVSGASSPENISLLGVAPEGKLAQRLVAGSFLGQSLLGTPEQWQAFKAAPTTAEKTRIATAMGLGVALPAAGLAHAAFREAPKTLSETLAPVLSETAAVEPPVRVPPVVPESVTAPEPVLLPAPKDLSQAARVAWEKAQEQHRETLNVRAVAEQIYNDSFAKTQGPGPKVLSAEQDVARRKVLAQTLTNDPIILKGFDEAHRIASEMSEAELGVNAPGDRPYRWQGNEDVHPLGSIYNEPTSAAPPESPATAPAAPESIVAPVSPETATAPITPEGTRIEGPALVDTDGNVIIQGKLGETHADLMKQAMAGPDAEKAIAAFENDAQHVFVNDQGNVLNREQAAPVGVKAGQIPEGTTKVESQMLKAEEPAATTEAPAPEAVPAAADESTTGIAQRVNEARTEAGRTGEILPGEGVSAEEMVNRGRELLKGGADPEAIITGVSEGKAVTGDEMAVLRARREELSRASDQAADELRKNPDDPALKQSAENAFKAETDFAQRIKPAATEWHKVGEAMQGETEVQTGTFTGLRRAFVERTGRDVTPKESVTLEKTADRVKKANTEVDQATVAFSEVVKKETETTLPKTAEELRNHFAEKFKKMLPC